MPWTRYSSIPARTQGEKHLIDFSVCSQGGRNRLTVDTDREKRARVEWPIVNLRTNGTFHGRFWVGLIAVNLARNNLNRARVRDSHLSAINPFAHRSSRSMASLFPFAAGIVLRIYIYFFFAFFPDIATIRRTFVLLPERERGKRRWTFARRVHLRNEES